MLGAEPEKEKNGRLFQYKVDKVDNNNNYELSNRSFPDIPVADHRYRLT